MNQTNYFVFKLIESQKIIEFIHEFNNSTNPSCQFIITESTVSFNPSLTTFGQRSSIIETMLNQWRNQSRGFKLLSVLKGWRNELYPVYGINGEVLFSIERSAAGLFGVRTYGSHLTAYTRSPSNDGPRTLKIWVSRRSRHKSTYPLHLDNTVAGGIPYQSTPTATIIRECLEEANIPTTLSRHVKNVGAISYFLFNHLGIAPETEYCFDLELPMEFIPSVNDGEVEEFLLCTVTETIELLRSGEFKPNCAIVLLDFLIRHGFITPENEPNYLKLVNGIHRNLDSLFPGPMYS
ncbi:NUDIX hydrolase domain-like protein [Paraphysoderma sedebokerense]|nr:NUDIX hydrolase domain-like protein [Paraphysoderma sedebokerense]